MPPGTPERCHLFFLQRMLLENGLNSLENAMEKGAIAELKKSRKQWARSFNLSAKRTQFYPLDYQGLDAPMVKNFRATFFAVFNELSRPNRYRCRRADFAIVKPLRSSFFRFHSRLPTIRRSSARSRRNHLFGRKISLSKKKCPLQGSIPFTPRRRFFRKKQRPLQGSTPCLPIPSPACLPLPHRGIEGVWSKN